MTTLELSAVEVANLPTEGTFWIVREGEFVGREPLPAIDDEASTELRTCNPLPKPPPAVFTQACAPCAPSAPWFERLHTGCNYLPGHFEGGSLYCNKCGWGSPCPDCRIELVGPCFDCADDPDYSGEFALICTNCLGDFSVHVGWAYAVGQPLPIVCGVGNQPNDLECIDVDGGLIYHWPAGKPPHYEVDDYEATDLADQLAHYNVAALAAGGWYALELRRA